MQVQNKFYIYEFFDNLFQNYYYTVTVIRNCFSFRPHKGYGCRNVQKFQSTYTHSMLHTY